MKEKKTRMEEMMLYGVLGLFVLLTGTLWMLMPKPILLAVVDMNAVIARGSQQLARQGKTSANQIKEWGDHLKEDLEAYAQGQGVILIAKGAVVGGVVPDVTQEIIASLEGTRK